jgi:hypothetical protein
LVTSLYGTAQRRAAHTAEYPNDVGNPSNGAHDRADTLAWTGPAMWETIGKLGQRFVESPPILFLLLGIVVFILGAAGGVTYNQWLVLSLLGGWLTMGFGVALVIFAAYLVNRKSVSVPKAGDYEIKIITPNRDDPLSVGNVDKIVKVAGTIGRALPEKYSLEIFRIYPGNDTFMPIGRARMKEGNKWSAEGCDLGGQSGDTRIIGAYVVGPIGKLFLSNYRDCQNTHWSTLKQFGLEKEGPHLPLLNLHAFSVTVPDVAECDSVSVRRK